MLPSEMTAFSKSTSSRAILTVDFIPPIPVRQPSAFPVVISHDILFPFFI
jgi:hypothetical protein